MAQPESQPSIAEQNGRTQQHFGPLEDMEPALEYLLPVGKEEMREEHQLWLTPWSSRFMELSSEDVDQVLQADWRELSGCAGVFRDQLQCFTARSLHALGGEIRLGLSLKDMESKDLEPGVSRAPMLTEPIDLTGNQVAFLDTFKVPGIHEFFRHFHGVYISLYIYYGRYGSLPEPVTELHNLGPWEGSLEVMNPMSENVFLLNTEGEVGDWSIGSMSDCAVQRCSSDFGEFLKTPELHGYRRLY